MPARRFGFGIIGCGNIGRIHGQALNGIKNGALGLIEGSTLSYPGLGAYLDIYAEKATVRIVDDKISSWHFKDGTAIHSEDHKPANEGTGAAQPMGITYESHKAQLEDMLSAIEENREPLVSGAEARKSLNIILSVYKSSRESIPISL